MLDNISQSAIFILSILATFMVARKNKWGFAVGFISQPFWIYPVTNSGKIIYYNKLEPIGGFAS